MKRVSIIIPVYNLEKYLVKCIESVINQTYKNLEIIILDDGSNDHSLEICKAFENKDGRVKVFSHPNQGVSYTRNRGIELSTGDYIMFVDGDDYLEVSWVENYIKVIEESNADVVIGGISFLIEADYVIRKKPQVLGEFSDDIWNCICMKENEIFGYIPNKLYCTEMIKTHNVIFDETMFAQEDFDFALSAYGVSKKIIVIDECGYIYRYISGKRNHPLLHYIRNQIKLLSLAESKVNLSSEQKIIIVQKIQDYLYKYIYYLPIDKMFVEKCKKIETIESIHKYLGKYSRAGEQAFVLKMILYKRYHLLKMYFCIRHILRGCLRRYGK